MMIKPPHDLRDYLLGELEPAARAEMEVYLEGSSEARQELARLQATHGALLSLPQEEPPRRIAFVSDKVFEPSPWARLKNWLWVDGPRLALGTAALLAVLFAGVWATEPRVTVGDDGFTLAFGAPEAPAPAPIETPAGDGLSAEEVQALIAGAVAASEQRQHVAAQDLVRTRTQDVRAELERQVEAARADMEDGLYIVNRNYETLYKSLAETELAVNQ